MKLIPTETAAAVRPEVMFLIMMPTQNSGTVTWSPAVLGGMAVHTVEGAWLAQSAGMVRWTIPSVVSPAVPSTTVGMADHSAGAVVPVEYDQATIASGV